ncbi:MAG: hypothetical protein QNK23_14775 [Crocinitomicaceae bacterium]|nr:hypothetical protein [Crocinitomicaceae bacterium]
MAEKKQQKLKQILLDLNSQDSKKISKAIKALEAHGDASVIKPLAKRLLDGVSNKNQEEIIELLSSLKDTSTCVEIIDVLDDEQYRPIRQLILTAIWNTKVDFSDYIDDFIEIAVEGNLLEALDCLTIIENLEGPFMEENILESLLHLKNYSESDKPKDDQKAHILSEIAIVIRDIDQNLMD